MLREENIYDISFSIVRISLSRIPVSYINSRSLSRRHTTQQSFDYHKFVSDLLVFNV